MSNQVVDKWFVKSRFVWGAIIAFLPGLLVFVEGVTGVNVSLDVNQLNNVILDGINSLNELIGYGLMIWGRYNAPGNRLVFKNPAA